MWFTLLKGLGFKAIGLLRSPTVWIVLLGVLCVFLARGWAGARADVALAREACAVAAEVARAEAAEQAAEAWKAVVYAHQEALVRLSLSEAAQEANARHWKQKYQQALKTSPACAAWAQQEVACPID